MTTVPDLRRGPALFALRGVTPDYRNGQMQQFNLSVQRELGKQLVATVGFVGSAGAKLYWARNINQPDPGARCGRPATPVRGPASGRNRHHMARKLRQLFLFLDADDARKALQ